MTEIIEYKESLKEQWAEFCYASDSAWFWHTREWFEYSRHYLGDAFLGDYSFLISESEKIVAVVPCMLIKGKNGNVL